MLYDVSDEKNELIIKLSNSIFSSLPLPTPLLTCLCRNSSKATLTLTLGRAQSRFTSVVKSAPVVDSSPLAGLSGPFLLQPG